MENEILKETEIIRMTNEVPTLPTYLKEQSMAKVYPVPLAIIVVISAIISLIINMKRRAKIRILLSIIFPIIAVITTTTLSSLALKCAMDKYSYSIAIPAFIGIGILIIMNIVLIAMIFKRKK